MATKKATKEKIGTALVDPKDGTFYEYKTGTVYQTTESLAALVGVTGTTARKRIERGEWKPDAETASGKALFSETVADDIVRRETARYE